MEGDYSEGYKQAVEMVKDGKIKLQEAENLVSSDPPVHDVFVGESRKFVEGFIDALDEMLRKAREKEEEA
jgi:hypothetical protein